MSNELATVMSVYALVFCRVGSVFILLPGLSGARLPATVRLMLALAFTVAITPLLYKVVETAAASASSFRIAMFTELLIGLAFGFWCYCFLHACRFAANIIAATIGLAGIPGQPIDDTEPSSHLSTLLSLAATAMIFATDLHLVSLSAIVRSYDTMPALTMPATDWLAWTTLSLVRDTSVLALQMASPFIVISVAINLALGICSKFTPQLQIYFAAMGLTILLSLVVLSWIFAGLGNLPVNAYARWLDSSTP